MKACKIILIVILIIKTIRELLKTFHKQDAENPVKDIISSVVSILIVWGLYYGAGILDI